MHALTVFSWTLTIDGFTFDIFSDVQISHQVSGCGMSGIMTSTLTVTTYNNLYSSESISANAEVILKIDGYSGNIPIYYVSSRQSKGNFTSWTCVDKISSVEQYIDFTDNDFDSNGQIDAYYLAEMIATRCGFNGIAYAGNSIFSSLPKIDREQCEGNSARNILEMIGNSMCGYWRRGADDSLVFVGFGYVSVGKDVHKHSKIIKSSSMQKTCVILTDGDDVFIAGSGSPQSTIMINTSLATQNLANAILDSVQNYTYVSWQCEKGLTTSFMDLGLIYFADGSELIATNITLYPAPAGFFFEASANSMPEDNAQYISFIKRSLQKRIEADKVNGNVAIGKKGIYFFENGYKESKQNNPQSNVKYGFNVQKGGITEYDGAIVSKVVPSAITTNADASEVIYNIGEKSYKLDITWNGDNISNMSKSEV